FADSSALPTWHVARETRRAVTVALTGDAGDELFGGYDRYRALALTELFQRLPDPPRRWIGGTLTRVLPRSARSKSRLRALERLFERINEPAGSRYLAWMTTFDEVGRMALYSEDHLDFLASTASLQPEQVSTDPASVLTRACASANRRDRVTRAMVGDILTYLPGDLLAKVDMTSMAHSLECRGPFLDHRVVELAAAMPLDRKLRFRPGRSKVVLKRAFADLLPRPIRSRRKMGFGVPVGRWFRDELKQELRDILLDRACLDRGLFRPEAVQRLFDEHTAGQREHGHRLWALVMLELWFRNHFDGQSPR
ncbi:MAG: asparagine synthetase B family protein, partial [Isosphaeraceae bacterium]